MLTKIRKFTKLSSEEKKLFIEAYVTLGIMHASILTISFKRLTSSLEHRKRYVAPKLEKIGKMAIKTKGNWSSQTDNNGSQTKHKVR